MTWLRWLLLTGLAVVTAAALSLSAQPIVAVAADLGVPETSQPHAVVMIEGAVLVLTLLWLHPATTTSVRWMAAAGVLVGLSLSASAGVAVYGPAGCVPGLLYAWLVHTLSRDLLGTTTTEAGSRVPAEHWGGPDTVPERDEALAESVPVPDEVSAQRARVRAQPVPEHRTMRELRVRAGELGVPRRAKDTRDSLAARVEAAERAHTVPTEVSA